MERGERCEEGGGAIASIVACGQISIKEGHAHGDDLPREIKMINYVEGPVTDLFPPRGVQLGDALVGCLGGVGKWKRGGFVVTVAVNGGFLTTHGGEAIDYTAAGEVAYDIASYTAFVVLRVVDVVHGLMVVAVVVVVVPRKCLLWSDLSCPQLSRECPINYLLLF
jgi:hypothetical protein